MREPKLGVIDYMMRGFRIEGERDLVFVPLGINYDRVLEDRSLLIAAGPDARRVGRVKTLWNTLAFAAHNLRLMLKSEWHRFGYACVNFGSPVSMRAYCSSRGVDFQRLSGEERKRETAALGEHLMRSVSQVVPVVPVPLMATVFVRNPERRLAALELKAESSGSSSDSSARRRASTCRGAISTTRSTWACGCCSCGTSSTRTKGCTSHGRRSCPCCATTRIPSPTCWIDSRPAR